MIDAGEIAFDWITPTEILTACGDRIDDVPAGFTDAVASRDLTYRSATVGEVEAWATMVLERMHRPQARRSPTENQEAFERGWRENLDAALKEGVSADSLRPRYFRETPFLRYRHGLIVSENKHLEHDLFTLVRRLIFTRYLADCPAIREHGCGSCGNLLLLSEMFTVIQLHGFDWADSSVEIAALIANQRSVSLTAERFNMRRPAKGRDFGSQAGFVTVHELEQLGQDFNAIPHHFLECKPERVVHLEPVVELYDERNIYDYLAIEYSSRRGYLSGYLAALREMAVHGRIEKNAAERPYIGGVIHGSSIIV